MIPGLYRRESNRLETLNPTRAGLVCNPATPADVMTDLVADPDLAWAFLIRADVFHEAIPNEHATVLAAYPRQDVRAKLARSPFTPLGVRVTLAADRDQQVRRAAASRARAGRVGRWQRFLGPPLPTEVYEALAADEDPETRIAVCTNPDVPREVRATLARDEDPEVRKVAACRPLPPESLAWLLADRDPEVRKRAWVYSKVRPSVVLPATVLREYLSTTKSRWSDVAAFVDLTYDLFIELMDAPRSADLKLLPELARNPSLPVRVMEYLAESSDPAVLRELVFRPDLPAHLYNKINSDPDGRRLVEWLLPEHAPLDVRLSYIDNPKRVIRRTVATGMDLPADAVRRLADDEDFVVRLLLCECHPEAPGETLAEVAAESRFESRMQLVRHKNFPPAELAPYARSKSAHERAMVADLPNLPTELALTLLGDHQTRGYAAANPNLPSELLPRMLDDPDEHVRFGVARNAALPPDFARRVAEGWIPTER
jgi:hypothetical protein